MAWPSFIPTFATGIGGITVTKMNQLRDALNAVGNSWDSWSPTVSGNATAPTMGASSIAGKMRSNGKTVDLRVSVTLGSGFVAGVGAWTVSLPSGVSPLLAASSETLGYGICRQGTTRKGLFVEYSSGTTVALLCSSDGSLMGATNPFTWATGDRFSFIIPSLEIA